MKHKELRDDTCVFVGGPWAHRKVEVGNRDRVPVPVYDTTKERDWAAPVMAKTVTADFLYTRHSFGTTNGEVSFFAPEDWDHKAALHELLRYYLEGVNHGEEVKDPAGQVERGSQRTQDSL